MTKYPIKYHPIAFDEAVEAITYLESQRLGYGQKFKVTLDEIIDSIRKRPERYRLVKSDGIRRKAPFAKPFHKSYSVYYDFDGEKIYIISIFHNKRDQDALRDRK